MIQRLTTRANTSMMLRLLLLLAWAVAAFQSAGHAYDGHSTLAAENATTTLYRAVGPGELADINAANALRNLGSAEGKYFTTSAADASAYAKQAVKAFGDPPYTIIKTEVPNTTFNGLTPATVDRGIPAWVIPNNRLPGLMPLVEPTMPIPPRKF